MNVQAARASGHLPVSQSRLLAAFANQAPRNSSTSAAESPVLAESPARPVVQSWKLSEAAKEKLDAVWADAIYATALPFNLLDHPSIRTAINTTADLVRTLGPLSVLRRSSEFRCCRERTVTHMNGGKYIPPNRKRLADDLLDKAEARETESLKDVLIRLARQKNSGSIVLDGRKSISKLPMVNFLFHCADGTWLIECVDTNDWRSEMEDDETKGDCIFQNVVEHIDALNKIARLSGAMLESICQHHWQLRQTKPTWP